MTLSCPDCGFEPDQQDLEFKSGSGFDVDRSFVDAGDAVEDQESLRCPICGTVVDTAILSRTSYDEQGVENGE
jgi:predicted RNA-binding Zn-ribbon protein involved in translation (DUF1610 family)